MVLPGAVLFPNAMMPLFIFEPRYRAMLTTTLETNRMFCVAMQRAGINDWTSTADFHDIAGIGLVRASVARDDGTSHLVLQGVARARFVDFIQDAPYVVAQVSELASISTPSADTPILSRRVLGICAVHRTLGVRIPDKVARQLIDSSDQPSILSDLVAHALIKDSARRQQLLEIQNVDDRLRALIEHLNAEAP